MCVCVRACVCSYVSVKPPLASSVMMETVLSSSHLSAVLFSYPFKSNALRWHNKDIRELTAPTHTHTHTQITN